MNRANWGELPDDLVAALEAEPGARRSFEEAGESYRNGLVALVREVSEDEHRSRRIALVIKALLQHGAR